MKKKPAKRKKKKHFIADDEMIGKIIDMGAFEYSLEKMTLVLCLNLDQSKLFIETAQDPESEVYNSIQMGKSQIDYAIDCKLLALIKSGDLKALEEFERRKFDRNVD